MTTKNYSDYFFNTCLDLTQQNLELYGNRAALNREYLGALVWASVDYIEMEGIDLQETVADENLVATYAAFLFRDRGEGREKGMPRHIRYMLNNRLLHQKMEIEDV